MDGEYGKSIEHYLPKLVQKPDAFCNAAENGHGMLQVTYSSLKNVCADLANREAEQDLIKASYVEK